MNSHNIITANSGPNDSGHTVAATVGATAYTGGAGACARPPIADPAEKGMIKTAGGFDDNLSFLTNAQWTMHNAQRPDLNSITSPSITNELIAGIESVEDTPSQTAGLLTRIGEMISPTVYSQERQPNQKPPTKGGVPAAPHSGETITVNGAGTGFTLPAGKSTTITYRVTINNPTPAITQVSNQGTVSGGNFSNVLTDDPNVAGTANPTVRLVDNTTVAIASNATPAVFGQNITFTATMTGVPSRASDPPGTVQFKADGNNIGAAVPIVVGTLNDNISTATASISTLSVPAKTQCALSPLRVPTRCASPICG